MNNAPLEMAITIVREFCCSDDPFEVVIVRHVGPILAEVAELRKRRDDLLEANNRLVEERRAMRAERDALRKLCDDTLAQQRVDAIDGQSAMDEANNRIVALTTELDEARRQVAALREALQAECGAVRCIEDPESMLAREIEDTQTLATAKLAQEHARMEELLCGIAEKHGWQWERCEDIPPLVDKVVEQRDTIQQALLASEKWRQAYYKGKTKLYSMGGEIAEAAMKSLPCSEGPLESFVSKFIGDLPWQENAVKIHEEIAATLGINIFANDYRVSDLADRAKALKDERDEVLRQIVVLKVELDNAREARDNTRMAFEEACEELGVCVDVDKDDDELLSDAIEAIRSLRVEREEARSALSKMQAQLNAAIYEFDSELPEESLDIENLCGTLQACRQILAAELDEAQRQVAALRAGLQPFAEQADGMSEDAEVASSCGHDAEWNYPDLEAYGALTVADLSRARSLYHDTATAAEAYEQRIREDERWKVGLEDDAVIGNSRAEVAALRDVLDWAAGGPVAPDYEDFCERARKALDETVWNAEAYELRIRGDERRRMYAAVDALRIEVAEHVEIADDDDAVSVAVDILRQARGLQRCVRCDSWGTNLHHTGDDSDLCAGCLADLESEGSDG